MPSSSASSSSLFVIVPLDGLETCRHAMDACYRCAKPLSRNCDVFMYRGDAPFCSEECRGVQMEADEVRARNNAKILRERGARNEQRHGTSPSSASEPRSITRAGAANVPVAS